MNKPFAPSCERNRDAILDILKKYISEDHKILLEVGSGTGQHAYYFAPEFPKTSWQTSDCENNHNAIKEWIADGADNILSPLPYEIGKDSFPEVEADIIFTANTFHIMSWKLVKTFIKQLGQNLKPGGKFIVYGPFNKVNKFTSESNEAFDKSLREKDPKSGIRSLEDVSNSMLKNGIFLKEEIDMPANNKILIFEK